MSITTYSELKTAIQNWAINSETYFTDRIDEFIDLAEARMSKDLRTTDMITTSDVTVNALSVAVPSGFSEAIRFYLDTSPKTVLDFVDLDRLYGSSASAGSGTPIMYSIEGGNFIFAPTPDSSYTGKLAYYRTVPALSDSQTTNNILTNAPEVYLAACLIEAYTFLLDDEAAAKWAGMYDVAVKKYTSADKRKQYAGPLQRRADANP